MTLEPVAEVARRYRLKPETLMRAHRRGELKVLTAARPYLTTAEAVEEWIRQAMARPRDGQGRGKHLR